MMTPYERTAADLAYLQRRAEETGCRIELRVSSRGFTIEAFARDRSMPGSTTYQAEDFGPLPESAWQTSLDQAIQKALGPR